MSCNSRFVTKKNCDDHHYRALPHEKKEKKEKKKKITLSVTEDTDKKISDLSKKYGMTKSGLVTILVQKANENGIFN